VSGRWGVVEVSFGWDAECGNPILYDRLTGYQATLVLAGRIQMSRLPNDNQEALEDIICSVYVNILPRES
jgi:hypothetical protein